jgi:hypothetical protein
MPRKKPEPRAEMVSSTKNPLTLHLLPVAEERIEQLQAVEQPKRRGRPPTGQTPAAERQRASRARRAKEGGKHISVTLSPEGAEHLGIIMIAEGKTEKEALEAALRDYSEGYRR